MLYDDALIDDARGTGGSGALSGSGGSDVGASGGSEPTPSGGDGFGATGGEANGSGGTATGGLAGNGATAGNSGAAGSSANGSGGTPGAGGDTTNDAGQAGTSDAGAGGDPGCSTGPGCECGPSLDACTELTGALIHRYDFAGEGTTLADRAGTVDGEIFGTALSGDGSLLLAGGVVTEDEVLEHVAFPAGCLSGLVNATFEMWFTSDAAGPSWQRIFDFGELSTATTGTSLWFSPLAGSGASASSRAALSAESPGTGYLNQSLAAGPVLASGAHHAAVVVDDTGNMLSLYVDGAFAGAQALPRPLANVNDDNCWLGRSNDASDPYFAGSLDEFRVYDAALGAEAIALSFAAGPNPAFFGP